MEKQNRGLILQEVQHVLALLFLFLLPWQTRYIWKYGQLNGGYWEYGTGSLYVTEILLWVILVLFFVNNFLKKEVWVGLFKNKNVFSLVFAGFFVLVSIGCFVRYNMAATHTEWNIGAGFCLMFSIITVCFALIASGVGWAGQVDDIENIKKFQQVEVIYQKKAEALTTEFAKHLADAYPKHEREIFEKTYFTV